jgi:hypothetical protein
MALARRLLNTSDMCRWWLVLAMVLAFAPAAGAQPASPGVITGQAQASAVAHERRVGQLTAQRATLAQRYAAETEQVERLKEQKRSWRTDRLLQERLAEAKETADQLRAITDRLTAAQGDLARARAALVAAIDVELEATPVGPRAQQLVALRAQLAAPRRAVHRIVLPDTKINPLADPEELDEQAAAIRESEGELSRQVAMLESQGKELDRVADLRKQHERAKELDLREDNTVRRPGGGKSSAPAADGLNDSGSPPPSTGGSGGGIEQVPDPRSQTQFEADAITQLANVIDVTVTNDLSRAQRSGDPAQRAEAARKARDAVNKRLELLRKKRGEIEKLAKDKRKRSEMAAAEMVMG